MGLQRNGKMKKKMDVQRGRERGLLAIRDIGEEGKREGTSIHVELLHRDLGLKLQRER